MEGTCFGFVAAVGYQGVDTITCNSPLTFVVLVLALPPVALLMTEGQMALLIALNPDDCASEDIREGVCKWLGREASMVVCLRGVRLGLRITLRGLC
jgi:hypothetical protein